MKCLELQIHGHVQGVAFRWHTQREAEAQGLVGWVRNQLDGTVRVLAEGDPEQLQVFLAWIRQGPAHARVDQVDVTWGDASDRFTIFEITG